jgi:hypothetical protein
MQQQFIKPVLTGRCRLIPANTAMSTQPNPTQRQDDS